VKRPTRKRCSCGRLILWALDDADNWVDVDPQATLDRTIVDPLVLWSTSVRREQLVSRLADFEKENGPYTGPVWQLHMASCSEMDRAAPQLSARGRRLLEILAGGKGHGRNGGSAA
jgi:hypothetical protein